MDSNITLNCIVQANAIDLKTIILALSLLFSTLLSVFFYVKNRSYGFENIINERLFKIQDIAFNNPFLESKKFIDGWNEFTMNYRNNVSVDFENNDIKKYLQYEQYCEMIFNLISDTYSYSKTENKLLELIDFKEWTRTHKDWWKNPLEEHSNHDTYDRNLTKIIDEWVK